MLVTLVDIVRFIREVSVFRLVSKDTIEEQIYELGQKKLQLEKNVMEEKGKS